VAAKKAPQPVCVYLEPEEMKILLSQPDQQSALGLRDYALLRFLYNTGARVSEALGVRLQDLSPTGTWPTWAMMLVVKMPVRWSGSWAAAISRPKLCTRMGVSLLCKSSASLTNNSCSWCVPPRKESFRAPLAVWSQLLGAV
jgi:hypothetical protein